MENKNYMADEVRGNTGVNVARCYQCGKCSAGCATAPEMDYPPSLVLRMLQTRSAENDRKVLGSNTIWLCLNCENCIARCPQQIDIPRMMDYLREESLRAGCVGEKAKPVVAFPRAFLDSVKYTGRLYEVGLIAGFKARTMRLAQDLPLVPDMLAKGKLSLLPEQVKNKKAIRHIFDEAGKAGKKL